MSAAHKPERITVRTYLEHGLPFRVLAQRSGHSATAPAPSSIDATAIKAHSGPRNVLIERVDGSKVVHRFRGLRRVVAEGAP